MKSACESSTETYQHLVVYRGQQNTIFVHLFHQGQLTRGSFLTKETAIEKINNFKERKGEGK